MNLIVAAVFGCLFFFSLVLLFVFYNKILEQKKILNKFKSKYNETAKRLYNADIQKAQLGEKLSFLLDMQTKYNNINKEFVSSKEKNQHLATKLAEQNIFMQEKLEYIAKSEKKLKFQFEQLSSEITKKNTATLDESNKKSMQNIITPMQTELKEFKKRVEYIYDKDSQDRARLSFELQSLKELNLKMSKEAKDLTNALKYDNKTQGSWGEVVLDKVLESSGLRLNHEYKKQVSLKDKNSKIFLPDVVVYLPDNRHIIIDAKTSLVAYNQYINENDKENKKRHLKEHINSIKEHIKGLSSREYEKLQEINSLDFVFMFLPIESALLLALENDVSLFDDAFKQKIILVSPSTLLVALRAVENSWRYEKQVKNINEVYSRAEKLYDKFVGFTDDMLKIGKGLDIAKESYDETLKKLSSGGGNLVNQVMMLKKVSNIKSKSDINKNLIEENS